MEELKPCPFCGGEARMHVAFASGGDHSVGVYVECLECRSCSGTKWGDGSQEKAADVWNRRANDCDREDLLALADELESCGPGCDECPVLGKAEFLGDRERTENVSRYCARRIREISGNDACEVTTVSAYDLLSEEDREALAWVREMGGVEAAKARMMPEGCEWPRFEDGEPVKLRDVIVPPEGGEPREVDCINHFKDCWYIGLVGASSERLKRGDHVKRPENLVLAADGEPLEVGQTVYGTRDQTPVEVIATHSHEYDGIRTVKCKDANGCLFYCPEDLTHAKPEQPDTWERLEHDAEKTVCEYFGTNYDCANCPLESARCAEEVKKDIIRRAKKLAEREQ